MPTLAQPSQKGDIDYETRLQEEHQALLDMKCFKGKPKYLVIALDEFQTLVEAKKTFLPCHIFCKVIKLLQPDAKNPSDLSTWVIFTSTNSRISHFSAPSYMRMPGTII
jgi:hypothetical protein